MKANYESWQAALELIAEWTSQDCAPEVWCKFCGKYQTATQRVIDEVCTEVCDVCGNVIDPLATPF